jgi:hypothetical protein
MTSSIARVFLRILLLALAGALAGCETTGTGVATDAAAKPVELPMTRTRAAEQCWMSTEKGSASMSLDKRADLVDKCIDQKIRAASGDTSPAPAAAPEAKKKKPASAAADTQKKKPAADAAGKDAKPADGAAPDKKP